MKQCSKRLQHQKGRPRTRFSGEQDTGNAGNAPEKTLWASAAAPLPVLHTVTHLMGRG